MTLNSFSFPPFDSNTKIYKVKYKTAVNFNYLLQRFHIFLLTNVGYIQNKLCYLLIYKK